MFEAQPPGTNRAAHSARTPALTSSARISRKGRPAPFSALCDTTPHRKDSSHSSATLGFVSLQLMCLFSHLAGLSCIAPDPDLFPDDHSLLPIMTHRCPFEPTTPASTRVPSVPEGVFLGFSLRCPSHDFLDHCVDSSLLRRDRDGQPCRFYGRSGDGSGSGDGNLLEKGEGIFAHHADEIGERSTAREGGDRYPAFKEKSLQPLSVSLPLYRSTNGWRIELCRPQHGPCPPRHPRRHRPGGREYVCP